MSKKKPLILVTNDDGITAPGMQMLVSIARKLGEVVVVAPDSPQSGQGHAITLSKPLRLHKSNQFKGIEAYACSGTPVDCVKLANNIVLKGRKADLCLSGINHGSNSAINILYSGTMSAAMEASIEGIDSIGFSLLNFKWDADFSQSKKYVKRIIKQVLKNGLQGCNLINVNIPDLPKDKLKGIKVCHQANARWVEDYKENEDPYGKKYYWLTGKFVNNDKSPDSDVKALEDGYISVVPSGHDLTIYKAVKKLGYLNKK